MNFYDKLEFSSRIKSGEKFNCPCCGRWAQVYRRRIHATMARQIIELYSLGGGKARQFVHASLLIPKGETGVGDIGKAAYWGLVEKMNHEDQSKKHSGLWRITETGIGFAEGTRNVRAIAVVFDNNVIDWDGPDVSIEDCLKDKFNYGELMGGKDGKD